MVRSRYYNKQYGFDQQRLMWYVCRLWYVVIYPTGDKHTLSTFVDQTHIQRTRLRRKTVCFKTSLPVIMTNLSQLSVYEACVLRVLLYGSETWTTYRYHVNLFERFHQNCIRRILNIVHTGQRYS